MKFKISLIILVLALELGCRHSPAQVASVPPPVVGGTISLIAGTTLAFRTAQEIDLPSARLGQTYDVVVSRDANAVDGQTILPGGSPATLIVLRANPGVLGLASATLHGDAFLARNQAQDDGPGEGGAALGAFLGGVPGTRGPASPAPRMDSIEVLRCPVGSLLTFRLDQPIRLIGSDQRERWQPAVKIP